MSARARRAWWAVAATAARQTWAARAELWTRIALYAAIVLVFSRLWAAVGAEGALGAYGPAAFLWYLALTEWLAIGTPHLYLTIEEDVRRGDVAYQLARPGSYLSTKLAEGFGEGAVRMAAVGVAGFGIAWLCAGRLPADPRGLLLAVPLAASAFCVLLLFQVAVGLAAFPLQEASPVYWIFQKLLFVFGGLLFPLEVYPDWLSTIAYWTPFEPLLHGVGRAAYGFDPAAALATAARQLAWGVALFCAVGWFYRRAVRRLEVNGG